MSKAKAIPQIDPVYLCRRGCPGVIRMTRQPSASEIAAFAAAGLEQCTLGERYTVTVSCSDGSSYPVRRGVLLDGAGDVVGSYRVDE